MEQDHEGLRVLSRRKAHGWAIPPTDCCCPACDGPEGMRCVPDVWGSQCVRCGRGAVVDDADTTAEILEAIAERIASQVDGQTSWL